MGIAAYNRGSAVISAQYARDRGERMNGVKPVPRPAGWGGKAAARALASAHRFLSAADSYGLAAPSEEVLAELVREQASVGHETATTAARIALGGSP